MYNAFFFLPKAYPKKREKNILFMIILTKKAKLHFFYQIKNAAI